MLQPELVGIGTFLEYIDDNKCKCQFNDKLYELNNEDIKKINKQIKLITIPK